MLVMGHPDARTSTSTRATTDDVGKEYAKEPPVFIKLGVSETLPGAQGVLETYASMPFREEFRGVIPGPEARGFFDHATNENDTVAWLRFAFLRPIMRLYRGHDSSRNGSSDPSAPNVTPLNEIRQDHEEMYPAFLPGLGGLANVPDLGLCCDNPITVTVYRQSSNSKNLKAHKILQYTGVAEVKAPWVLKHKLNQGKTTIDAWSCRSRDSLSAIVGSGTADVLVQVGFIYIHTDNCF